MGEALKKNREEGMEREEDADADGEWEDDERKEKEQGLKQKQKVYVLDRGFVGWQERFGEDVRLTEGYRKEIWMDGY